MVDRPKGVVVTEEVVEDMPQEMKTKTPAKKKSMKDFISQKKQKEQEASAQRSDDWETVQVPDGKKEKAAFLKQIQEERRLKGYDPETGEAMVLKSESRKRIDSVRKKEEL